MTEDARVNALPEVIAETVVVVGESMPLPNLTVVPEVVVAVTVVPILMP